MANASLDAMVNEKPPQFNKDPPFERYFRMLMVGLPIGAVKNVTHRNRFSPKIMDIDPNQSIEGQMKKKATALLPLKACDDGHNAGGAVRTLPDRGTGQSGPSLEATLSMKERQANLNQIMRVPGGAGNRCGRRRSYQKFSAEGLSYSLGSRP